jgi:DNA end-binding protein Ku
MMMATMHFPDEIRGTADLDLPEELATITKPELKMATALVDQLTGPFEPEQYEDEYRGALERMIEAKLGSAEPVTAAAPAPKGKVGDLMEALKASIESAKAERAATTKKATKAKKTTSRKRVRKAS